MTRGPLVAYVMAAAMVLLGLYGQLMLKSRASIHQATQPSGDTLAFLRAMLLDPWVLSSFASALAGALCWLVAIRDLNLSVLYPVLASSFLLIPLGAAIVLHERILPHQILGCAVIFGGIVLATWPK